MRTGLYGGIAFVFLVCVAAAGQVDNGKAMHGVAKTTEPAALQQTELKNYDQELEDVAQRTLPAVVQIQVSGYGTPEDSKNQQIIERQRAIGSGVIVDPDGYIVTNNHVVAGAQRIRVVIAPMAQEIATYKTSLKYLEHSYEAKLIGANPLTDLAVIKIDAKNLPFIPLPLMYRARLGQTVLAIGSPEGLDHTVTKGIVSAVGRQPELDRAMVYIQTDAPINPGNSGGALVDRDGNLVGINTYILTSGGGSEGLGFAIPEPTVRFVYEELKTYGRVRQAEIGANAQTITPTLAAGLKLPQDWGVIISDVTPNGPADKAGLKPKDIVTKINGSVIDSLPKYVSSLYLYGHDAPLQVEVLRGTQTVKLSIIAVDLHSDTGTLADMINPQTGLIAQLGIFVVNNDKQAAGLIPDLRSDSGVIVAGKANYMPVVDADLTVGDVIFSVNNIFIHNVTELHSQMDKFKPGDPIVLEIERQGIYQYVAFDME
jgi:serine protease Do